MGRWHIPRAAVAMKRAALVNLDERPSEQSPLREERSINRSAAPSPELKPEETPEKAMRPRDPLAVDPTVTFTTSAGAFTVEFHVASSPVAVANVLDLVRTGFFNGLLVHRVVRSHGVQFGCPFTKSRRQRKDLFGRGGPKPHTPFPSATEAGVTLNRDKGGNVPDEFVSMTSNTARSVCLASAPGERDSRGSQLFINTTDNTYLDWFDTTVPDVKLVVIGRVTKGWHTINAIESMPVDEDDVPDAEVTITNAVIADDPLEHLKPKTPVEGAAEEANES